MQMPIQILPPEAEPSATERDYVPVPASHAIGLTVPGILPRHWWNQ